MKRVLKSRRWIFWVFTWILGLGPLGWIDPMTQNAHAVGVYNLYRFVEPGNFAFGPEAELTLTNGASFGGNARITYGLSSLTNIQAIVGTGSGNRRLRFGTAGTFDFIPDIENQPGIGLAAQAVYYRMHAKGAPSTQTYGQLETLAIPYIHKNFVTHGGEFEPFVAVPFGLAFMDEKYKAITSVVLGSMFKGSEKVRYVMELGVAINNSDTYVSAGVVYYP